MPKLTFVLPDGSVRKLQADPRGSVMEAAVANNVEGIIGECGGAMSCATCHVFVDDETFTRIGGPSESEADMLEFATSTRHTTSRLSCQLEVNDELDGATFTVPRQQQ